MDSVSVVRKMKNGDTVARLTISKTETIVAPFYRMAHKIENTCSISGICPKKVVHLATC